MQSQFVHLHVHTEYSLVDSIARVKPLLGKISECGMPAVAITDRANLFALVKFYRAAMASGVKPIIGADVWIRNSEDVNQPYSMVLLAQNDVGYLNLKQLVSRSYQEGQHLGRALIDMNWLNAESTAGLIALSGASQGDVGRALIAGNYQQAANRLEHWLAVLGDRYYLQLVRTGREHEESCLHASVKLAMEKSVPVVATNDVMFLEPDDFQAHEVRVCIHDGRTLDDPRRSKLYSEQQYLRSPEEMAELFQDIPEALENSLEIAKRCNLEMLLGEAFLPDFPVPEGMTMDEFFRAESHKGLELRLQQVLDPSSDDFAELRKPYDERLEIELGVIIDMGFPGYFLIVADFIQWAKDNQIPVGPGRGSGAGSVVAWVMKITDLDPLEHELLFERFLNPERVSMPDFDVDFCMDKRDLVIDYVARTYGRDAVSQIITYGTMAAKAVVRDVGRVLGHPYGFTDRVAKMIPFEIGMTLQKALSESEELKQAYENDEEVTQLIDMAKQLEGLARNAGKHAGGVVIAPTKLTDFSALYCDPDGSNLVTQFDKNDVEAAGLVKFDFLGLRTLTVIDWALNTVNASREQQGLEPVDISSIPVQDKASFDLLKQGRTTAVFQLESHGIKELIKKLKPDCFEEITALVALYRPGPLGSGMVDDFVQRKHGQQEVVYPHPKLESILKPTYGVILYQEQVMQIAQVLAGYTLGGADMLRRAMGKKKPEEMAKQGEIFRAGAVERGVDEEVAKYIFDLMEKFAGYGFNKSHSAAYALVSYQTLWLKTHYPAAFMAAVMSADMDNTDKVVVFIEECRELELEVLSPDVNRSDYMFTIADDKTVIYGLGAIKGVGEAAIEGIVETRKREGEYADLFDFCRRIDLRKANRRVLESLIRCGALDQLGANRATLMIQLPLALKIAEQHNELQAAGQNDLFGMADSSAQSMPAMGVIPDDVHEWDDQQRLRGEKETLGLFLTGHPMQFYEPELPDAGIARIAGLSLDDAPKSNRVYGRNKGKPVTITGLVIGVNTRNTQKGMMAALLMDDMSGRIEVTLFNEAYEKYRELLLVDMVLVLQGSLVYDEYRGGISVHVDQVLSFEAHRLQQVTELQIELDEALLETVTGNGIKLVDELANTLQGYRSDVAMVRVHYTAHKAQGMVRLGRNWMVTPVDELLRRLYLQVDMNRVKVIYGPKQVKEQAVVGL